MRFTSCFNSLILHWESWAAHSTNSLNKLSVAYWRQQYIWLISAFAIVYPYGHCGCVAKSGGGGPRKSQLKSLYCYCLVICSLFWLHTFLSQVRGQSHRPVKEARLLSWCAMWCLTIGSFMLPVRIAFLHQQNHTSAKWMLLIGGLRSLNEVSFCLDYCFIPLRRHVPETRWSF